MRKITKEIVAAFLNHETKRIGNSYTDGTTLFLHGNAIARHRTDGCFEVTTAGWNTPTTRERLNGLPGIKVNVKQGQLYLNDFRWDGNWARSRYGVNPDVLKALAK